MALSQSEYTSENEDSKMQDYLETHHLDSKSFMSEDNKDDLDYIYAERNGSATDSEIEPEYSPNDFDTESIPEVTSPLLQTDWVCSLEESFLGIAKIRSCRALSLSQKMIDAKYLFGWFASIIFGW